MKYRRYTPEQRAKAVKEWQARRLAGESAAWAASMMRMSQASLSRWEAGIGRLPDPPRSRKSTQRYGMLHVEMRKLQGLVVPLRPHESGLVQENIEATCRRMPSELRAVWERALREAGATNAKLKRV